MRVIPWPPSAATAHSALVAAQQPWSARAARAPCGCLRSPSEIPTSFDSVALAAGAMVLSGARTAALPGHSLRSAIEWTRSRIQQTRECSARSVQNGPFPGRAGTPALAARDPPCMARRSRVGSSSVRGRQGALVGGSARLQHSSTAACCRQQGVASANRQPARRCSN